ncbi:Crp/Fnr family transcriptional regulator [Chryseobacterium indologenes]|uniref:Crp/Fnr family transcriptional regulator n=1 Tax=Chryseobacterium TaxID=59732 RepID=UPI0016284747|nr:MULTISPECIES: Crp/Fnr family transcriptional regulator [Chryseobacterium]MDM1554931.1 Crp/Fnr family transcriptional regulator [Chryseobacterium indologenes]WET50232.1 Crp/Fnr family transcriptional regulator [Chryseobacterium indologenes]
MLLEKLFQEFNVDINTFNTAESELFDQFFEKIWVKKNTFLIQEGELEKYSYFIFNGITRCWTLNHKGEEQTFWFCKEGSFSLSNISFTLQEKSTFNVQTITDCEIYKIDQEQAVKLYEAIPGLKAVFEDLTARLLNKLLHRNINLIKYSPEQYYLQMMSEYGSAFNNIPLKDIASYLGITPQALSRIRKRIF